METYACPNILTCKLVSNHDPQIPGEERREYLEAYCKGEDTFPRCKRYQVKMALGFCPDFVLPETEDDLDTIITRFDETEDE
jgi:hypothetical protein